MTDAWEIHAKKTDEEEKIVPLLPDLNVTIITVCLKRFYVRPEYVGARFEFLSKSNCPDVGSELWLYIPLKGGMKKGNSGREVFKSFEVSLSELSDDEIMFDPFSASVALSSSAARSSMILLFSLSGVFLAKRERTKQRNYFISPNGFQPRTQSISQLIAPKDDL